MKKFFAIVLLTAYLFNLTGYNLFFQYSIHRADQRIIGQIDKHQFSDDQLIEVKVKLNLPYLSDWSGYERIDGEIELQGIHYNYVKRKVSQDTMYMLCLPNSVKTELFKGKNNYLANSNDPGKESNSSLKKILSIDEFKQGISLYDFALFAAPAASGNLSPSFYIPHFFMDTPGQPPEANS